MRLRSVRFKISVLYTGVLGIILIAYGAMLYFNLQHVIYRELDKKLRLKAIEVEDIINSYANLLDPNQELSTQSLKRTFHLENFEKDELFQWPSIKKLDQDWKYKIQMLGIKDDYIVIYYPSGEVLETSRNVDDVMLSVLKKNFKAVPSKVTITNYVAKDVYLRIITRPFYRWGRVKYVIQLATPLESYLFVLRSKMLVIVITVPLFLLFTSFLGQFFVINIFKPIAKITNTAKTISHEDMSQRVALSHADEEIRSLVEAFNDMISRLEKSFKYIEEFSSNVAHKLKTPLAIIRGELEVALRKDRAPEEYRQAIQIGLEEVQRMLKTINDLLLLAKLDYRTEIFKFEDFDLVDFLTEIYEQTKIIAGEKNISVRMVSVREELLINATKLHLRRLFFNLLDNAIKFTPRGGHIDVVLTREDKTAVVAITDSGVGIAEEDLPKIFDRFFHVDRTQSAPSVNGLGLSIVQSILKIHNGSIEVKSELGKGATFITKLPLV